MIVLVTTRGNGRTLKAIARGTLGVPTPEFRITYYERLFGAWRVPRATYVFGDIERLAHWELRLAAQLFRLMVGAGLRCLNDPARAMARVELLTTLHSAGINPFTAWRADEQPRPVRFPVFLRTESDHAQASADLIDSQADLDGALASLRDGGVPLRGMLVVEQAAEPYAPNLWAKWGTWRIGDRTILEHLSVDDTWLVKIGDKHKMTAAAIEDERQAVVSNRWAGDLRRAFDLAGIDFGRADHSTVAGRTVVYEINTNPYLGTLSKRPSSQRRQETSLIARQRIADALEEIDTRDRGTLVLPGPPVRRPIRWWMPGFATPRRP